MISPAMAEVLRHAHAAFAPPADDAVPIVTDRTSAAEACRRAQLSNDPGTMQRALARVVERWLRDLEQATP